LVPSSRPGPAKVAACVTGPIRAANLTEGLLSIRRNLADALEADLLLYVPVQMGDLFSEDEFRWALGVLAPVRTAIYTREWTDAELSALIHAGDDRSAVRLAEYRRAYGNWRAPLFGESGGNLLMLYQQATCRRLVAASEVAQARRYKWVIFSRLDLYWLFPHPPVHRLGPESLGRVAWIPAGQDWGWGLNDRHATMERSVSDAYLSRWDAVVDGSVLSYIAAAKKLRKKVSGETLLKVWLQRARVNMGRFSPVAAVLCCREGPSCQHEAGTLRPKISPTVAGIMCAKYPSEEQAMAEAVTDEAEPSLPRLQLRTPAQGWIWALAGDARAAGARGMVSDPHRRWELQCCMDKSGPVTCWAWMFRRRCMCIESRSACDRSATTTTKNGATSATSSSSMA